MTPAPPQSAARRRNTALYNAARHTRAALALIDHASESLTDAYTAAERAIREGRADDGQPYMPDKNLKDAIGDALEDVNDARKACQHAADAAAPIRRQEEAPLP